MFLKEQRLAIVFCSAAPEARRYRPLGQGYGDSQHRNSGGQETRLLRRLDVLFGINMDNLYVAQNEKNAALQQYLQALRGYWLAYYRLRRTTLYDFEKGEAIHQ